MFWSEFEGVAVGSAAIAAAVVVGRLLYQIGRRKPDSMLVRTGMTADMVWVVEVILIVTGPLLLLRALINAI